MFGTILSRLILSELVKVFVLSLIALTGMFLLAGLIQEATQRGLSPGQIIMVIPLLIPNTLPYTIPTTTLFATCVVYGRMAHDNEITVIRSAGVHILHLFKPAVLLGLFAAAVTMWLYIDLIPSTQSMMRERLKADAEDVLYNLLKREGSIRNPSMPYVIFVKEVQGKRLLDVIFKKRAKADKGSPTAAGYDVIARAREAKLRVDPDGNQLLIDMENVFVVGDKETNGMLRERTERADLPEQIFGKDTRNRPSSLTWLQLRERRIEVESDYQKAQSEADKAAETLKTLPPSEETYRRSKIEEVDFAVGKRKEMTPISAEERAYIRYKDELISQSNLAKEHMKMLRNIDTEFQTRPALAFGCLCFVLIGAPVGILASRADYLSVFMVCFLPTVFIYYPFMMSGTKFAKDGRLPQIPAVWFSNGLLVLAALLLIRKLLKR